MLIEQPRFLLRDFIEADRAGFLAYQMDPRYLALYDFDASDVQRPNDLFDLFRKWSGATPRCNFQIGIFDRRTGELCGCAGLRKTTDDTAILGIELAPATWGRFALALDVAAALIDYGFRELRLATIFGDTASGNKRVAKLARWFGADLIAEREGPEWMRVRGFREVDWAINRAIWESVPKRRT
jgi:ribosomal-protein-alanine N-acetyltransferase